MLLSTTGMLKTAIRRLRVGASNLKSLPYEKKGLLVIFALLIVVALGVRYRLLGVVTPDYTDFLKPWMEHMSSSGLSGLGDDFSNYNTPYLVLLWLASFLPFSDLVSIKLISILFDLILALAVYMVVKHFKPKGFMPFVGFLAVLFAPVVIQNGSMWGQCDAIYTSFLVFAFYALLKKKIKLVWVLWAVAFAFKLQAIFFLPFVIFATLYYKKEFIKGPLLALVAFSVLSFLPVLFGKSPMDVLDVYIGQTGPIRSDWGLAWFAPTAYQWVSNEYFEFVRKAGILFGGAVAICGIGLAFVRKFSQKSLLVLVTVMLLAIPFFLPTIHERYLFSAEIFLIITACVIPKFIWAAIGMQIVTTMAYLTYFTQGNQDTPIPFAWLSVFVFVVIYMLAKYLYVESIDDVRKEKSSKSRRKIT